MLFKHHTKLKLLKPNALTVSIIIFFCSMAISFLSSICVPCRNVSWLFSISSMFCTKNDHRTWSADWKMSRLNFKYNNDYYNLDKLLIKLFDGFHFLVLHNPCLLEELLLLAKQILQKQELWSSKETCEAHQITAKAAIYFYIFYLSHHMWQLWNYTLKRSI